MLHPTMATHNAKITTALVLSIAKMEVEETLAIYRLQIQKRKEEKKQNRCEKGLFVTLYADLRANPDKVF